jgi:hypothetical protein
MSTTRAFSSDSAEFDIKARSMACPPPTSGICVLTDASWLWQPFLAHNCTPPPAKAVATKAEMLGYYKSMCASLAPDARTHGLFAEISVGIRATPRAGTRCDEWRSPRTSCAFTLAGGPRLAVACSQTGCQLAWLQFQPHAGTRRRRSVASATFTMARSACDGLRCPRMIGGRAPGELWGGFVAGGGCYGYGGCA